MKLFDIYERLALTNDLVAYTSGAAWALLSALAVATFSFAFLRAALSRNMQDPAAWAVRALVTVTCLSLYGDIIDTLIEASQGLARMFIDRADWFDYWRSVSQDFEPMHDDPLVASMDANASGTGSWAPSVGDRIEGMVRAGLLSVVVTGVFGIQFWTFDFMTDLSALFLSLLRIAGPLMIAAGIVTDGKTTRQWFSSVIQVLLWPVVPPMFMMIVVQSSGNALHTGNTAFAIGQALSLAVFTLATPLIVAFLLGKGGIALGALALSNIAMNSAKAALPSVARTIGLQGRESAGIAGLLSPKNLRALSEEGGSSRPGESSSGRENVGAQKPDHAPRSRGGDAKSQSADNPSVRDAKGGRDFGHDAQVAPLRSPGRGQDSPARQNADSKAPDRVGSSRPGQSPGVEGLNGTPAQRPGAQNPGERQGQEPSRRGAQMGTHKPRPGEKQSGAAAHPAGQRPKSGGANSPKPDSPQPRNTPQESAWLCSSCSKPLNSCTC